MGSIKKFSRKLAGHSYENSAPVNHDSQVIIVRMS